MLIMMLSINSKPADELKGLRLGADDYVIKPFQNNVFLARVMVMFRTLKRFRATSSL